MTVYEFKKVAQTMIESACHTIPSEVKVKLLDMVRGIKVIVSATAVDAGLTLTFVRTVSIPDDNLTAGLGDIASGLLNMSHYRHISIPEGYGFPFDHTSYEVVNKWFLDFGNGVIIESTRFREQESRTTRILASLNTPWPEWRVAPGYPTSLNGVFGWDARWAEARAERSARACYKMLSASYRRLDVHSGKGAVQRPGAGFEPTQDHDNQTWPQYEL